MTLSLRPAPADSGVRFRRSDLGGVEIPASVTHLAGIHYATALKSDGGAVETIEHLLSALAGMGIDNVVVDLSQPEVPIMDGSASPFVYLVNEAGVKALAAPRRYVKVVRPVELSHGDKHIAVYPADEFRISYSISFDHPLLRHQSRTIQVTAETFAEEIAPARTFGFLKEVETLRQMGLAQGGSLENAVVLGETGVLNNPLRFEDEFVRHKMLDAVGDLSLIGHPIVGHVVAHRAGHGMHTGLVSALLARPEAWELVEAEAAEPVPIGLQRPVAAAP